MRLFEAAKEPSTRLPAKMKEERKAPNAD